MQIEKDKHKGKDGNKSDKESLRGVVPFFLLGLFDAVWFVAVDRTNKKRR